jgi:hypothetical protein
MDKGSRVTHVCAGPAAEDVVVTGTEAEVVTRVVVKVVEGPAPPVAEVDEAFVVLAGGGVSPPVHPTLDELTTTSSYQKVFVSPP